MSRFKAGDLALIVKSIRNPSWVGRAVVLKRQVTDGRGNFGWEWDGCFPYLGSLEEHLIPLRGDFTPEQSKKQERPVNA